jgi:hypothetical protein
VDKNLPRKKRVILIVLSVLIAFILMGLFFYNNQTDINSYSKSNNSPPFDFSISSSNSSCLLKQGGTVQTTIYVTKINGTAQTVNLNSDAYITGISCDFSPSSGEGNFSSIATIAVWNSTASNSYKINITATSNTTNHSLPYNVNVLSSKVQVSRRVVFSGFSSPATAAFRSITFIDSQTNETIMPYSADGIDYGVTLENEHGYEVTINWGFYPLGPNAFGHQPPKSGFIQH